LASTLAKNFFSSKSTSGNKITTGIIGALTEILIDTSKESVADISALKHTLSGGFGSCRYKMKSLDDN
jgi:hypothetical protein